MHLQPVCDTRFTIAICPFVLKFLTDSVLGQELGFTLSDPANCISFNFSCLFILFLVRFGLLLYHFSMQIVMTSALYYACVQSFFSTARD